MLRKRKLNAIATSINDLSSHDMCNAIILEEPEVVRMLCDIGLADELIDGLNATRSPLALAATIGNIDVCRILLLHSHNVHFSKTSQTSHNDPVSHLIHQQQPRPFEICMLQTLQSQLFKTQFEQLMSLTMFSSDVVKLILLFLQIPLNICLDNTHYEDAIVDDDDAFYFGAIDL